MEDEKRIIVSSFSNLNEETLNQFINHNLYNQCDYISLNYPLKKVFFKLLKYRKAIKGELNYFLNSILEYKPDKIICFSDEPIPYQILFNLYKDQRSKSKDPEILLVEEGTAIYLKRYKHSIKEKLRYLLKKSLFGEKDVKFFFHGQGGFADGILAREPQLILTNNDIVKHKLDRKIFYELLLKESSSMKTILIKENSALLCPSGTTYSKKKMLKMLNEVFSYYSSRKMHLYVKLHPSEKFVKDIEKMINIYNEYVYLIKDNSITSEDLLFNNNIIEVISDYSSVLVNAYYIRDNIRLITYKDYLEVKHKITFDFEISIFEHYSEIGIIKNFNAVIRQV